jgi:hypothetical protein
MCIDKKIKAHPARQKEQGVGAAVKQFRRIQELWKQGRLHLCI